MDIKHYYENTQLTLEQIAAITGTTYKKVWRYVARNYSKEYRKQRKVANYRASKLGDLNPMLNKTREQHPRYIGKVADGKGYLLVVKPDWYTGRKGSHHIFEHSKVVCENLGLTEIPAGYCVHHCDGNPQNNDFSNLVMLTLQEHRLLHAFTGATTISKESTLKWVEAHRAGTPAMI